MINFCNHFYLEAYFPQFAGHDHYVFSTRHSQYDFEREHLKLPRDCKSGRLHDDQPRHVALRREQDLDEFPPSDDLPRDRAFPSDDLL